MRHWLVKGLKAMVGCNWNSNIQSRDYNQGRIKPPKAARGHATPIDGIVLNVTKFRIQILPCVISRSARTIEVLSAYIH